jgi:SAM-dependent methyltransferase
MIDAAKGSEVVRRTGFGRSSGEVMSSASPTFIYSAQPVALSTHDLPALKAAFLVDHITDGSVVLDVGCGGGKMLKTIAANSTDNTLLGCDIREPVDEPVEFEFRRVDSSTGILPYADGSVDVVLLVDVLEHVEDPARILAEVHRVLRGGGLALAVIPVEGERLSWYHIYRRILGADLYARTKEHIQAFSHNDADRLFAADFNIEHIQYAYHFVGSFMDASMCALLSVDSLETLFWTSSPFHGDGSTPRSRSGRAVARIIAWANAVAWLESRVLRRMRRGSATHLVAAVRCP